MVALLVGCECTPTQNLLAWLESCFCVRRCGIKNKVAKKRLLAPPAMKFRNKKKGFRVVYGPEIDDGLFHCLTNKFFAKDWGQEEMHVN